MTRSWILGTLVFLTASPTGAQPRRAGPESESMHLPNVGVVFTGQRQMRQPQLRPPIRPLPPVARGEGGFRSHTRYVIGRAVLGGAVGGVTGYFVGGPATAVDWGVKASGAAGRSPASPAPGSPGSSGTATAASPRRIAPRPRGGIFGNTCAS
jgi:hypothetical protein